MKTRWPLLGWWWGRGFEVGRVVVAQISGPRKRAFLNFFGVSAMIGAVAQADIIHPGLSNPGFELGNLTDWTATLSPTVGNSPGGTATVVASTFTLDGDRYDGFVTWAPVEGGKFALLRGGPASIYQKLSTLFIAAAGDRVVFNVFFDITDELGYLQAYNDDGYVKLVNTTTSAETMLFASSVATLPRRGNSGWTSVDYTIPTGGNYRLEFAVRNMTDFANSPQMGIDALSIPAPAAPFSASISSVTEGEMHIHFVAQTGLTYTIQYKASLTDATWLHLADIAAPLAPLAVDYNDTTVGVNTQRFYRVVTP